MTQRLSNAPFGRPRQDTGRSRGEHRARRRIAVVLGAVMIIVFAGAALIYLQLNGNIHHSALNNGIVAPPQEAADPAGRTALNILLIGSDTRDNAQDCALGGDCGPGGGANADVEMLVHLAPDRSSATVLSIPRDTVMSLPACKDTSGTLHPAAAGLITTSLRFGPGCTVAAVGQLTGLPIDHFVMVDFAGVVAMSDAVGGVDICVTGNVYDPYSHLKLSSGTHTLVGNAALEFLRTRHGFGDGSDLGREQAQHVFLSSLIQKLKSVGTLDNPATVYTLAQAATKALTVDDGLAGIAKLAGLAATLNAVPGNHISLLSMPNVPDPANSAAVLPASNASALFRRIQLDQPLQEETSPPSTSPSTPPLATRPTSSSAAQPTDALSPASPAPYTVLTTSGAPGCVAVGSEDTTPFGSPQRAYADNPQVADSAP